MTPLPLKINLINQTVVKLMTADNNLSIIQDSTESSIQILDGDFGFAWDVLNNKNVYKLTYKSPLTPYEPTIPVAIKKESVKNEGRIIFDDNVLKENYNPDISAYLKSYIIIPVNYGDHVYGRIVICYKKKHDFTKEELALADTMGHIVANSINTNWLVENEQKSLTLAEKQKETEVLLSQEKLKTEFIQNATHELRTPLAIMKGNIDLLEIEGKSPEQMMSTLKAVNTEIGHMSHIIEDLALITSSKGPDQDSRRSRLNILHLLETTIERLSPISNEKKVSIKITVEQAKNLFVLGHEDHLEKLFTNIIKNAITYGKDNGKIVIEVLRQEKFIKIKINDNGIGISKEDLPKLFERFYRTEDARMISKKGTGLGLAISKWIAETHGGKIEIDSTFGKGTLVIIELPLLVEEEVKPL